jgi:hypothetical protein
MFNVYFETVVFRVCTLLEKLWIIAFFCKNTFPSGGRINQESIKHHPIAAVEVFGCERPAPVQVASI